MSYATPEIKEYIRQKLADKFIELQEAKAKLGSTASAKSKRAPKDRPTTRADEPVAAPPSGVEAAMASPVGQVGTMAAVMAAPAVAKGTANVTGKVAGKAIRSTKAGRAALNKSAALGNSIKSRLGLGSGTTTTGAPVGGGTTPAPVGGGGGGGGGGGDGAAGAQGPQGPQGPAGRAGRASTGSRVSAAKSAKFLKVAKIGGGLAAAGIQGISSATTEWEENKAKGLSDAENLTKSTARGVVAGGGAGLGAVGGAIVGQALIPIPIVGAAVGAAVGGWVGGHFGDKLGDLYTNYGEDDDAIRKYKLETAKQKIRDEGEIAAEKKKAVLGTLPGLAAPTTSDLGDASLPKGALVGPDGIGISQSGKGQDQEWSGVFEPYSGGSNPGGRLTFRSTQRQRN